ncbi:hypothetical protein J6590_017407 [Homalodisca vitripennis]|nr:hypothetical protein J6590_017407 [Homalodisca vitripennis]
MTRPSRRTLKRVGKKWRDFERSRSVLFDVVLPPAVVIVLVHIPALTSFCAVRCGSTSCCGYRTCAHTCPDGIHTCNSKISNVVVLCCSMWFYLLLWLSYFTMQIDSQLLGYINYPIILTVMSSLLGVGSHGKQSDAGLRSELSNKCDKGIKTGFYDTRNVNGKRGIWCPLGTLGTFDITRDKAGFVRKLIVPMFICVAGAVTAARPSWYYGGGDIV